MATGTIILPITAAIPDPTNPCGLAFASGTSRPYLTFDGSATIESCIWTFRMPENYSSALTAKIIWSGSASTTATDTAQWTVYVMAMTPDTDSVASDSDSYDTENVVSDDILGTTAKRPQAASVTLTNADSVAANDYVAIRLLRDYSDAADDLAEDAWVWAVSLEYTTS